MAVTVGIYTYKTDVAGGAHSQCMVLGVPGSATDIIPATLINGLAVDVTRVSGSVAVTGPITDAQLRATPLPVNGTVAVTGALTDTQLRATALPVSGPVTDAQLRASAIAVRPERYSGQTMTPLTAWDSSTPKIIAANATRHNLTIENATAQLLYILAASAGTVSRTFRTIALAPGRAYEMPTAGGIYTGAVQLITEANDASGLVFVTEG